MLQIKKRGLIPGFVSSAMYSPFSDKLRDKTIFLQKTPTPNTLTTNTPKQITPKPNTWKQITPKPNTWKQITPTPNIPTTKTSIPKISTSNAVTYNNLISHTSTEKNAKDKIFCIGLHKTATTTLQDLATKSNLKAVHTTIWQYDRKMIEKYDFFCDGGSHYNGLHEFDYKGLMYLYPTSKFIINIRDVRNWIISKCKHAGWDEKTEILNKKIIPKHDKIIWRLKSLENISKFIEHYCDWYIKIIEFFMNKKDRAIIIDIEDNYNICKLKDLLKNPNLTISHKNKNNSNNSLPKVVLDHIDYEINIVNKEKLSYLQKIIDKYDGLE